MTNGWRPSFETASDPQIDQIVELLRTFNHRSSWERTLAIGRIVFEDVIRSSEQEWRSHRGTKSVSLRKVVQHPSCPVKRSALCLSVNVYLFVKKHPTAQALPHITPTHVMQVFALKPALALDLLRQAADAGWSVRELGRKVRALRKDAGERRGRPVSSSERRAEILTYRALASVEELREHLSTVPLEDAAASELSGTLSEISQWIAQIRELAPLTHRLRGAPVPT